MRLFVCETCGTFLENVDFVPADHVGHRGIGIEGDSLDEIQQVAARHLQLAKRIRGNGPYALPGEPA